MDLREDSNASPVLDGSRGAPVSGESSPQQLLLLDASIRDSPTLDELVAAQRFVQEHLDVSRRLLLERKATALCAVGYALLHARPTTEHDVVRAEGLLRLAWLDRYVHGAADLATALWCERKRKRPRLGTFCEIADAVGTALRMPLAERNVGEWTPLVVYLDRADAWGMYDWLRQQASVAQAESAPLPVESALAGTLMSKAEVAAVFGVTVKGIENWMAQQVRKPSWCVRQGPGGWKAHRTKFQEWLESSNPNQHPGRRKRRSKPGKQDE